MCNKPKQRRGGFTLVEIMIVVAIIALLAAIAVPGFLRARKRSQASRVVNDLRLIDAAVDQYAIENNKTINSVVNTADWVVYLKKGSSLYNTASDLFGNTYGSQTVDSLPKVPTLNTLCCTLLLDVGHLGTDLPFSPVRAPLREPRRALPPLFVTSPVLAPQEIF